MKKPIVLKPHKMIDDWLNKFYLPRIYIEFAVGSRLRRKFRTASEAEAYGERVAERYTRLKSAGENVKQ